VLTLCDRAGLLKLEHVSLVRDTAPGAFFAPEINENAPIPAVTAPFSRIRTANPIRRLCRRDPRQVRHPSPHRSHRGSIRCKLLARHRGRGRDSDRDGGQRQ
jgi:hypothetical protein